MSLRNRFSKLLTSRQDGQDAGDGVTKPFPFLCLPKEIRQEIYRYVFGDEGVHLFHEGNRIAHIRCQKKDPRPTAEACCPQIQFSRNALYQWGQRRLAIERLDAEDENNPSKGGLFREKMKDKLKPKNKRLSEAEFQTPTHQQNNLVLRQSISRTPIALFLVNKEVSDESIETVYRTLVFQVDSLETWIRFRRQVSHRAFSVVRYLRASWIALACLTEAPVPPGHPGYEQYEHYTALSDDSYRTFWRIVARDMPGLLDLGFVMEYSGQYLSRSVDAEWHRPLRNLRDLKRFDLQIWDKDTGKEDADAEMDQLREFLSPARVRT